MNRHQRRLQQTARKAQKQGQGILQLTFIWREDCIGYAMRALAGDREAVLSMELVAKSMTALTAKPDNLCLLCERTPTIDEVRIITALHAMHDTPENAILSVICQWCGNHPRPEVMERARRKIIGGWTGLRPITIHEASGTA